MLKQFLSSLLWGAVLFVVQIGVDLAKKEPIDWQTTILASVILIVIHFIVSRGRTTIEDTNKKTGANAAAQKNIAAKAKRKVNNAAPKQEAAADTAMNQRGYSASDLKFYLYNRNSKLCFFAGIIGVLIWFLNSKPWFLYVGISFVLLAGVYYIFYLLKRNEFVEKQKKEKGLK